MKVEDDDLNKKMEEYLCDEDRIMESVPKSVRTKYKRISEKLPENSEQQAKAHSSAHGCAKGVINNGIITTKGTNVIATKSLIKKGLIGVVLVVIMIAAVILPIVLYPKAPAPSYQYTDEDLLLKKTSLNFISDAYDILLPSGEFFVDEQFNSYEIAVAEQDGKDIYVNLKLFSMEHFDELRMVIVLAENYDYTYKSEYENLSASASAEKFNYNYEVFPSEAPISKAKFIYGGYKYYIDLHNTTEPTRITTILNALS